MKLCFSKFAFVKGTIFAFCSFVHTILVPFFFGFALAVAAGGWAVSAGLAACLAAAVAIRFAARLFDFSDIADLKKI